MNLYAKDANGVKRKIKAVHQCIDGKLVELHKGTFRYYVAVMRGMLKGVVSYGT